MKTQAQLIQFPCHVNDRGSLTFGEYAGQLPFIPIRYFLITDVPAAALRGGHAHRTCHQLIIAAAGSCLVSLVDSFGSDEVMLESPTVGVYLPPLTWSEQSRFASGTVLLVLASEVYDEGDYIRSMSELLELGGHR